MQYLIDQARVYRARSAAQTLYLGGLTQRTTPRALFVACSDARFVPSLITAARPGDLIELRTHGGEIPAYTPDAPTGESRTIEYAVDELKVSDIIICGHSHCDVVGAALRETLSACEESKAEADQELRVPLTGDITAAGHWHVLAQLDNLSNYPCVIPRLANRSLRLHAWFHEIETGATLAHHPRANGFLPL
ncbi:carbonic anhydrase [Streptomyces sp. NPDC006349]|uniref:carbonic anhydrase n=1 Tax=Streptomyces sp. NPDC006349 TaxID=3156757 RepID=UPI0006B9850E|nr:hypothetical protein ADL35_32980 [Streptomyces sp. NRRL WC-3753]